MKKVKNEKNQCKIRLKIDNLRRLATLSENDNFIKENHARSVPDRENGS